MNKKQLTKSALATALALSFTGIGAACGGLGGGEYPHVSFAMQTEKDGWLYYLADITVEE